MPDNRFTDNYNDPLPQGRDNIYNGSYNSGSYNSAPYGNGNNYSNGYSPYNNTGYSRMDRSELSRQVDERYNSINGNQYYADYNNYGYNYNISPTPPEPPKKKHTGLKAFVISLVCVLFAVIIGLSVLLIYNINTIDTKPKKSKEESYDYNSDTSYSTETSFTSAPEASANPNGPQVSISDSEGDDEVSDEVNAAYQKVSKSIVCITSYEAGTDVTVTENGEGSGIIITADGYIATNSHVVNDSTTTGVMITLNDGSQYLGTIIGIDKKTDLAVIKIDAEDLSPAEFSDSDKLYVGQPAYAIGNPGGSAFSNSLTTGSISALNRILYTNSYVKYIQTDAAINPGNSGGALIDQNGSVVGMNTAKLVATDYESMGFAIPSNDVVSVVNKLIKYGYVNDRGTLGIEGATSTLYNAKMNGVPQGMILTKIESYSPLAKTNVREQDIITMVNGKTITNVNEFTDIMKDYKPGDSVTLTLFRPSSRSISETFSYNVTVKLISDR